MTHRHGIVREHGTTYDGSAWIRRREDFYESAIGPPRDPAVYHWSDSDDPHIDVYVYGRGPGRRFDTLVTGGLADRPQPGVTVGSLRPRRVELLLRMRRAEGWAAAILREIASLPFGHGIPLGPRSLLSGNRRIRGGSKLRHVILLPVTDEPRLAGFIVEGEEVGFLAPCFLTVAEYSFGLDYGLESLVSVLEESGADRVLDPGRKSVV